MLAALDPQGTQINTVKEESSAQPSPAAPLDPGALNAQTERFDLLYEVALHPEDDYAGEG
jgi:hypothetical protein